MSYTQYIPGGPPEPKMAVNYTGTDTLKNGYLLCANSDYGTAAESDRRRGVEAEKPKAGNCHRFLGVVTGLGEAGKVGPCVVEVARPCGVLADVFTNVACTLDRTVLFLQPGSYAAGSAGVRRIGVAAQTLDRHLTNGVVLAVLDTSVIDVPQQGLYTASDTQLHPLGMRYVDPFDGRVFRYGRAATGGVESEFGAGNVMPSSANAAVPTQAAAASAALIACGGVRQDIAAGAAGSDMITVTIDSGFGRLGTGVLTANELAGGYAILANGASEHPTMRRIVSHAALTTTGGALTLRLDAPLVTAVTTADNCEINPNPWANLCCGNAIGANYSTRSGYTTFMGIPTVSATVGQYFWLQTKGPCWITSNNGTCNDANDRDIFFVANGSVVSGTDATVETGNQRAGFAIDASASAASNGPLVYLQLD